MTDLKDFGDALYEAFLYAGLVLGERAKGMSCFLRNWRQSR